VDHNADSEEVVNALEEHRARLKDLREMSAQFNEYQTLFGMQPDEFTNLELTEKECEGRYSVWKSLYDFTMLAQDWTMGCVLGEGGAPRLSAEVIRKEVDDYATKAYKVRLSTRSPRPSPVRCPRAFSNFRPRQSFVSTIGLPVVVAVVVVEELQEKGIWRYRCLT
jgi:dynein heavy chain